MVFDASRKQRPQSASPPGPLTKEKSEMYRFISGNGHCRQVRHYRNQDVNATLRAVTGAKLLLGMSVAPKSLTETAALVASSPQNIAAAVTLLEAENPLLIGHVLRGYIPLLQAADRVRKRAQLIKAYRAADAADRIALGEVAGLDAIWDEVIAPSL